MLYLNIVVNNIGIRLSDQNDGFLESISTAACTSLMYPCPVAAAVGLPIYR